MPSLHLRDESAGNIVHVELTPLLGNCRVKQNLQENITKLFSHKRAIAVTNCFVELERFFNQVGAQRLVRLGCVPIASLAKVTHQRDGVVQRDLVVHTGLAR